MTIAEVGKKFNMSVDTLRYYERIGLIPEVNRNENGIRKYDEEDLKWVYFSKCMRSAGLSIEVLVEYVKLVQRGNSTIEARKKLLMEERDKLQKRVNELQETLDRLNKKIENYDTTFSKKINDLQRSNNN